MKTFQTLLIGLLVTGSLAFLSCKKDSNDPQSCNYTQELQSELDAVNAAASAYAMDPTSMANCNAYKTALQNYLDKAKTFLDCAALSGQQAELQSAIDQEQAAVNAIQC